jgi:hypothetical protein
MTMRQQTDPYHPHVLRFSYLTDLCFALGQRGYTSMLIHPRTGEAVLWVPFPHRPKTRLGVGAVESGGRWLYAWGNQWSVADDPEGAAARIIAAVSP